MLRRGTYNTVLYVYKKLPIQRQGKWQSADSCLLRVECLHPSFDLSHHLISCYKSQFWWLIKSLLWSYPVTRGFLGGLYSRARKYVLNLGAALCSRNVRSTILMGKQLYHYSVNYVHFHTLTFDLCFLQGVQESLWIVQYCF